jgi:hypothetical protein
VLREPGFDLHVSLPAGLFLQFAGECLLDGCSWLAAAGRKLLDPWQQALFQGPSDDQNTLAGMHDGARHQASEPGNAHLLQQESAHGVDTVGLWRQGTRAEFAHEGEQK